jgi:hypothetical protein
MNDGMDDQGSMHPLDPAFCRSMGSQHHFLNGVGDAGSQVTMRNHDMIELTRSSDGTTLIAGDPSQVGAFWQDLQSVVQMDMGQSQEMATSSNSYDG